MPGADSDHFEQQRLSRLERLGPAIDASWRKKISLSKRTRTRISKIPADQRTPFQESELNLAEAFLRSIESGLLKDVRKKPAGRR